MKKLLILLLLLNFSKAGAQTSALSVADSLVRLGKYAEAISVYEKMESPSAKIYVKMAQAYRAQGNLGSALENYELAIAGNEPLPNAVSDYGKLLYRTQKFKKADSVFQDLVKRFPGNPDFHYQLGLAKQQLKDSTAILQFREAFSLDRTHQKAIYELAFYHFKQKNYEKVERLGKKALESYAKNAKIIGLLAQNAMEVKEYPLAAKRFETLISLHRSPVFVHENLAVAYYHLGELKKALEQYQKILVSNPRHVTAYFNSGKINNLLENYVKAETLLRKAVALKKRRLDKMYQAMGMNYKLREMYGKAIDYFKLTLEKNPENIRAQYELAVAADNYYKELQTRLNYYKIFVQKFGENPNAAPFLLLVEARISYLKKEKFMNAKADVTP